MKAKINGVEVEGTVEEIGKMLGFTVVDLTDKNSTNIEKELREGFVSQVNDIIRHNSICKGCPHQGEGCNPQLCF